MCTCRRSNIILVEDSFSRVDGGEIGGSSFVDSISHVGFGHRRSAGAPNKHVKLLVRISAAAATVVVADAAVAALLPPRTRIHRVRRRVRRRRHPSIEQLAAHAPPRRRPLLPHLHHLLIKIRRPRRRPFRRLQRENIPSKAVGVPMLRARSFTSKHGVEIRLVEARRSRRRLPRRLNGVDLHAGEVGGPRRDAAGVQALVVR